MTGETESALKASYYRLMVYAAMFGPLSSLLTAGYITLYNQGIKFFEKPSVFVSSVNIWPLILLSVAGVFIGLAIKFFGQFIGYDIGARIDNLGRIPVKKSIIIAISLASCNVGIT
jgi:hypothetical protein